MAKDSKAISREEEMVTINLQPFLTPISILISSIIIASSILIGTNGIDGVSSGSSGTTGTTTDTDTNTAAAGGPSVTQDQVKEFFKDGNVYFGNPDSDVLFVEVGDPSCPYCHIGAGKNPELNKSAGFTMVADGGDYLAPVPEMKKLVDEGKAAFVWFYSNGHGNGELSAQALYCAHEKGKFWAVHDLLYTNAGYNLINNTVKNDVSKAPDLVEFLKPSGIDTGFLLDCLKTAKYADKIAADQSQMGSIGVSGTPGYFVNTKFYAGAYSWKDMKGDI